MYGMVGTRLEARMLSSIQLTRLLPQGTKAPDWLL